MLHYKKAWKNRQSLEEPPISEDQTTKEQDDKDDNMSVTSSDSSDSNNILEPGMETIVRRDLITSIRREASLSPVEAVSPPVESPPPPPRVFWNAWTDNCRDKLEEQESKEEVSMIKQEIPDNKDESFDMDFHEDDRRLFAQLPFPPIQRPKPIALSHPFQFGPSFIPGTGIPAMLPPGNLLPYPYALSLLQQRFSHPFLVAPTSGIPPKRVPSPPLSPHYKNSSSPSHPPVPLRSRVEGPPRRTTKTEEAGPRQRQRDHQRARELGLNEQDISRMISMSMEEFNEFGQRKHFNDEQLNLLRDMRRRGKNKVAAQNCRKRKLETIDSLQKELEDKKAERKRELEKKKKYEEEKENLCKQFEEECQQLLLRNKRVQCVEHLSLRPDCITSSDCSIIVLTEERGE